MTRMFRKGFKPKSTTKAAKSIIRNEMDGYYSPESRPDYGGKSTIENMTIDGNSATDGDYMYRGYVSPYRKAAALVDGGCFACYYSQQSKMLGKIYGQENVESWTGHKIHSTYRHLIGREYAAMIREQNNKP